MAQVGLRRRASSGLDPSDSPARTALTEADECLREHSGTRTTDLWKWGCMDRWRSQVKLRISPQLKASSTGDPLEASCHLGLVEQMESRGVKRLSGSFVTATVGSASSHVVWGRYSGTAAV